MALTAEFIGDLLGRACRMGFAWCGDAVKAEEAATAVIATVAECEARARKCGFAEQNVFADLRRQFASKKTRPGLPEALALLAGISEPRKTYLLLRHGGRLSPASAAVVLDIPKKSVSRIEQDAHEEAAVALGVSGASEEETGSQITAAFNNLPLPVDLESKALALEAAAIRASQQHARVSKPAILATSLSLIVIIFLLATSLSERMQRFPGYEKVAALLTTPTQPEASQARRVSANVAALGDWLLVNHGIDHINAPVRFSEFGMKSCRVFRSGNTQIIATELQGEEDVFLYLFRGADLGVTLPAGGKPALAAKEGWTGLVQAEEDGLFWMLATKGARERLDEIMGSKEL